MTTGTDERIAASFNAPLWAKGTEYNTIKQKTMQILCSAARGTPGTQQDASVVVATARIASAPQIEPLYSPGVANVQLHLSHGS